MITFPFTVSIMGVEYNIRTSHEDIDADLKGKNAYIFYAGREIVICDFCEEWKKEPEAAILRHIKKVLRHEITHAFLHESGLCNSSIQASGGWAVNEEMVDWFAVQSPKIFDVFQKHGLL